MSAYRVLIADDHPMARMAIRSLLEQDPSFEVVGEATNGEEAYTLCGQLQPDLVLMDINMPGWSGLEATRVVKKAYPHIKVVILSVSDDVGDLITAIQFGAQGYLLKNLEPDDWITYLHALLGEDSDVSREMATRLFHHFRQEQRLDEPTPDVLTPREREIVKYVGAGKTNREISDALVIAENTVKNHIKNILEKLQLANRVQLAAYAVRHHLLKQ
ncbi:MULTISPECIES: response regulator transcription factor [Bacillales]|jgi:two-component system, NarL family, nitrate/nitrite response regulator NarL|uniref:DNA-binding response regulator n=1 Tax=Brevibacillus aydinogluensis TaxID=927786 RepID=A0AA48MBE9_9BACL|nr:MULTISPECIES: response regulator transcription factor [Bacillales]REK61493.1 MAG: DNA-binding response regulator [Brevibacillus sp.]MBR8660307.1 response regulator transcription factor [Brevibacillus sp. NL20B1]MDT3416531.1 DNA-binding NarL/FixJ family response regulator [Brevibacillus aydinogluensis]NNV03528.1 response regulator transcription factor [Brevibacillus sp. MCWH]UFJ60181.1 response regulator transcription factor [Anoxybacillus sediminis]